MIKGRLQRLERVVSEQVAAEAAIKANLGGVWLSVLSVVIENGSEAMNEEVPSGILQRLSSEDDCIRACADEINAQPATRARDWVRPFLKAGGWDLAAAIKTALEAVDVSAPPAVSDPLWKWAGYYWPAFTKKWCVIGGMEGFILLPQKVPVEEWQQQYSLAD